ncbi:MAG: peptide chain release factor N(5)-glutamine methyltransferase [Bacilli bacterium]
MASNRELYFELKKLVPMKLNDSAIKLILLDINGFASFSELVKHFDEQAKDLDRYQEIISRVMAGVPIQYALGHAPFLELDLIVTPDVLIPRPETEELVLFAEKIINKEYLGQREIKIADIGTGSGAIAIFLNKRIFKSTVFASDISSKVLAVAKENAIKNDSKITFYEGNMLIPFLQEKIKLDVIISNPPYIEDETTIDDNVFLNEPHLALLAKPASQYYEEIFKNVHAVMKKVILLFFEIGENMEGALTLLIKKYLPLADYEFHKDIYGKTRFLYIRNDTYEQE